MKRGTFPPSTNSSSSSLLLSFFCFFGATVRHPPGQLRPHIALLPVYTPIELMFIYTRVCPAGALFALARHKLAQHQAGQGVDALVRIAGERLAAVHMGEGSERGSLVVGEQRERGGVLF